MLCGIHIDKKFGDSLLMARIGEEAYTEEIKKEFCLPMDFTGRPMRGYIFVTPEGFDMEDMYWKAVKRNVAFVPGKYFFTSQQEGIETMRLNYTMADEETIDHSIKILSEVIKL